jgi:uncharacterized protein YjiS (DUF1127 family)
MCGRASMPLTEHTRSRVHANPLEELYVRAGVIKTWLQRSRQRRALAELDDRILCDIGVTRSQAQREAAKPFWSAGKA